MRHMTVLVRLAASARRLPRSFRLDSLLTNKRRSAYAPAAAPDSEAVKPERLALCAHIVHDVASDA